MITYSYRQTMFSRINYTLNVRRYKYIKIPATRAWTRMPVGEGDPNTINGFFRGVPMSISVTLYVAGALTIRVTRMVNSTS